METQIMDKNPYSAPQLPDISSCDDNSKRMTHSRIHSAIIGCVVGLAVGVIWTFIFGPFTDGPPPYILSLLIYTTSFSITGLAVGIIRAMPPLTGAITGFLAGVVWSIATGPKDGWIIIRLIAFGGSGILCGSIVGVVFFLIYRNPSEPDSDPGDLD